jgi:hypothetical protein
MAIAGIFQFLASLSGTCKVCAQCIPERAGNDNAYQYLLGLPLMHSQGLTIRKESISGRILQLQFNFLFCAVDH